MKRIPELDGIRGVAICLVLIWHYFAAPLEVAPGSALAYLQAAGRLTWSGVDLFFVLSGFLIGGILLDTRERPDYFRRFYKRRFFRIVPIYAVVLGAALIFAARSGIARQQGLEFGPWYTYVLFLQNFWMARAATFGFLGVTWSLAVEEQFYLTLPAIVRFVGARLPYVIAGGIAAAPILRVLLFYAFRGNDIAPYVLMPCRADALLLGVAGAYALREETSKQWLAENQNALRLAAGILLAGAALFILHPRWTKGIQFNAVGFTMLALFYLCALLLAVTQPKSWLAVCLRWHWLRWLGSIAYGVYLLHQIVFVGLRHLRPGTSLLAAALTSLALTLSVATLSWHCFEKPLVQVGHQQ
jgi:peptidoglycan/LPS O-acetylase OafA/YrhL